MERVKIVLAAVTAVLISGALASGQQPPAKVIVAKVFEKEIVRTNQMVGIVDFDKQSGISSEVSGLIERVSIVEGTLVDKGAVLAKLNTDFIEKNIEIFAKQVEQVEIQIQTAEKDLNTAQVMLNSGVAHDTGHHLTLALSKVTTIGQQSMSLLVEEGLL